MYYVVVFDKGTPEEVVEQYDISEGIYVQKTESLDINRARKVLHNRFADHPFKIWKVLENGNP